MSVRLPERVGVAKARELSFTAKRITGVEAASMGLANQSVPLADLDASTVTALLAEQVAANSPGTVVDDRRNG